MWRWRATLAAYVLSGTLAAGVAGATLGWVGSRVAVDAQLTAAAVLALIGLGLGAVEAAGLRAARLQCDRETPRDWTSRGPYRWALRNGAALGVGATSRLGFGLWYAVPAGALLFGDVVGGAFLYGVYGLARTGGAYGFVLLERRRGGFERAVDAVLARRSAVRITCSCELIVLTLATLGVVAAL